MEQSTPVGATTSAPEVPIAAIVGVVLGGITLLILSGFAVFMWWRRQYTSNGNLGFGQEFSGEKPPTGSAAAVVPPPGENQAPALNLVDNKTETDMPSPEYTQVFRPRGMPAAQGFTLPPFPTTKVPRSVFTRPGEPRMQQEAPIAPVYLQDPYNERVPMAGTLVSGSGPRRKEPPRGRPEAKARKGGGRRGPPSVSRSVRVGLPVRPSQNSVYTVSTNGEGPPGLDKQSDMDDANGGLGREKSVRFA